MADAEVAALGQSSSTSGPWGTEGVLAEVLREPLPRLRGWLHAIATPAVLTAGVALVVLSPDATTRIGAAVFTACTVTNFAVSTAMHLGRWRPHEARILTRVDHACIFTSIAGSYTPFTLIMLSGWHRTLLLGIAWVGAGLGVTFRVRWTTAPRWLCTMIYVALGWAGFVFIPELARFTPSTVPVLLGLGVVIYTAGGLVYALRRPNPLPGWFGFHEVFHALSIAGFSAHYVALLIAISSLR
jgi:hemolysin III